MSAELLAILIGLGLLGFGIWVYAEAFRQLARGGGKVATPYQVADIPTVAVLMVWLGLAALGGFQASQDETRALTERDLLNNTLLFLVLVFGVGAFLKARQIPLGSTFGFGAVSPLKALGLGFGFLVAAYPFILLCSAAMLHWLGENAESQKILDFFKEAAQNSDVTRLAATAAVGIVVAPLAEEFLFRGYLYGVLRRYLGPLAGMVLCSALFAGIHGNLLALPALFVLAICLTLAYERTGSLLVPMVMHAIFNSITLGKLFYDSIP